MARKPPPRETPRRDETPAVEAVEAAIERALEALQPRAPNPKPRGPRRRARPPKTPGAD